MLITKLCITSNHSPRVSNNDHQQPARLSSSRMSDKETLPAPVERDWQAQHAYSAPAETEIFPTTFADAGVHAEQGKAGSTRDKGHHASQRRAFNHQGFQQHVAVDTMPLSPQENENPSSIFDASSTVNDEQTHTEGETAGNEQNPLPNSFESGSTNFRTSRGQTSSAEPSVCEQIDKKQSSTSHEADDDVDDADEDESHAELQSSGQPAAERLAACRKMKRFRLTHQQTQFLMSEFAKQPHPDVAHRQRLSKEIPGLSPRQVQVWFQNRRAKIKRLTADDRDRMMRMRAVPDDFDNVQALHSPYGALHGATTVLSTSDLVRMSSPYGNQGAGPLMVNTRRETKDSCLFPVELTPPFRGIQMRQTGPMNVSDMDFSANLICHDRLFTTAGISAPCPLDIGLLHCDPFRQSDSSNSSSSSSSMMDSSSPPNMTGLREIQSIQSRDGNMKNTPETLHTPLGIFLEALPGLSSSKSLLELSPNHFGSSVPSGFTDVDSRTHADNALMTGRDSDRDVMAEDSWQSRAKSLHVHTSGPLMMDFGFRDRYRNANLASSQSHAQDPNHAIPHFRSNMPSCQATTPQHQYSAHLDMPFRRIFQIQNEKAADYSSSQLSDRIYNLANTA